MREYQSNSHKSKAERASEKPAVREKQNKITKGAVTTRDNKGRKILDTFISDDAANVKDYILMDLIVPVIKNTISDIIINTTNMILGTGSRSSSSSGYRSASKVSYRSYYDDRDRRDRDRYESRNRFDYDEIVFATRADAEIVRRQMLDTIDRYGIVTVGDMYDMAGMTAPHTANNYGWVSIRGAEPRPVRGGYILDLPKPSPID